MKRLYGNISSDIRSVLQRLSIGAILMAALILGPGVYGQATSGSRLDPSLRSSTGIVNVRVTLNVAPEQFHQQRLTTFGVFAGRDANTIKLLRVPASSLDDLASLYWVKSIEPLSIH